MEKVFISYSSRDHEWAADVCRLLEEHGAVCFLDQRDLDRTKSSWAAELVRALTESRHAVLLLSRSSAVSNEVLNEMANASARGIDIIPVLKENIPIPEELMYYIRKYEWIHLYEYSEENGEELLCERVTGKKTHSEHKMAVRIDTPELTQYEDACFAGINNGGYGAGLDKCLLQNGVSGWKPEDVVLEEVDYSDFTFASIGMAELDAAYEEYCQTREVQKMRNRGNDRTRWMLAGIYQNRKIFLTLQKTRYSMTSFWWNQVRHNEEMQKKMARHVFDMEDEFYPNSFCLHLILETQDEYLIGTRISNNKKNDYGRSIAVTVGEQISEIDFASNTVNNDQFIHQWVKRTMIEELNFKNEDYERYVDLSSIRVLALSYEGDIYNFALPVFVRLKMDSEGFLAYLNTINRSIDEFTDIIPFTAQEALDITRSYADAEKRTMYHPSSFLRALLYAMYKGADQ